LVWKYVIGAKRIVGILWGGVLAAGGDLEFDVGTGIRNQGEVDAAAI
jgi:hypothetical protein